MICAACGEATTNAPCSVCREEPRLDGRYQLEEVLGRGSFGTTYRALASDGAAVAIKEMLLRFDLREQILRELRILRELDHRGIPQFVEDFKSRSGRQHYQMLVQEYIDGQTLEEEFQSKRYSARDVVGIIEEVAGILVYLHGLSPPVIHRDIKPANIIRRTDKSLVLIDFGLVRDSLVGTMGATREVGTIGYHAPEQFTGDPVPASDLFSLGAVAVRLLTRQEPKKLATGLYDKLAWRKYAQVSDELADLVDSLLEPEVGARAESASMVMEQARDYRNPARRNEGVSRGTSNIKMVVKGVGFEMVPCEPGTFTMGSPENEPGRLPLESQHPVAISRPFLIGTTQVTQALWWAVMGTNPSHFKGGDRPVEKVSWYDAVKFCNNLSALMNLENAYQVTDRLLRPASTGFLGLGARPAVYETLVTAVEGSHGFRLPTEAEWEYAARAGEKFNESMATRIDEFAWYYENAGEQTHPVAKKLPNQWGLFDMLGNVWEWCQDSWDGEDYNVKRDPLNPAGIDGVNRVERGGSFNFHAHHVRPAMRNWSLPTAWAWDIGIRVARSL